MIYIRQPARPQSSIHICTHVRPSTQSANIRRANMLLLYIPVSRLSGYVCIHASNRHADVSACNRCRSSCSARDAVMVCVVVSSGGVDVGAAVDVSDVSIGTDMTTQEDELSYRRFTHLHDTRCAAHSTQHTAHCDTSHSTQHTAHTAQCCITK